MYMDRSCEKQMLNLCVPRSKAIREQARQSCFIKCENRSQNSSIVSTARHQLYNGTQIPFHLALASGERFQRRRPRQFSSIASRRLGLVHKFWGLEAKRLCTKDENWENGLEVLISNIVVLLEHWVALSRSSVLMICIKFFSKLSLRWNFKLPRSCFK